MSGTDFSKCKALVFDLMGTCCDWKSGIIKTMKQLPTQGISEGELDQLALEWRQGFFDEIHARFEQRLPQEDIDVTHRRVLDRLLDMRPGYEQWDNDMRHKLVMNWHHQTAWPDAIPALQQLREKFFLVVLANGTARLQLDIAKSSGLPFHMLFSSQLLGMTKPDLGIYRKAVELMDLRMDECIMIAAHAYDLRAAKEAGMQTVYIRRETEDIGEDFDKIEQDVDLFVDSRDGSRESGLGVLLKKLDRNIIPTGC